MEQRDSRLIIVLLSIAASIGVAGCFAGYFVVYVWTNALRITLAGDTCAAMVLFAYFFGCALIGAAVGLFLAHIVHRR